MSHHFFLLALFLLHRLAASQTSPQYDPQYTPPINPQPVQALPPGVETNSWPSTTATPTTSYVWSDLAGSSFQSTSLAVTSSIRQRWRETHEFLRIVVFTVYRQLLSIVCIANLVAIVIVVVRNANSTTPSLSDMATASTANLTAAILIRQDYVKNILFYTCWTVRHSTPLWFRRRIAKIYENGGIHSGGAVCAVGWFVVFAGFLTKEYVEGTFTNPVVVALVYLLLATFLAVVIGAIPQVRRAHHNLFENTHRLGGWIAIALFWPLLILYANDVNNAMVNVNPPSLGQALAQLPSFWLLLILSFHAIYPWVRLRKVAVVKYEHLSDHAVRIWFDPKEHIPPLHVVSISDAPMKEWHGFASIPDQDGSAGGATSCIISKAGDWTTKTVKQPADFYYMRGTHTTGALYMAIIFRRVVVMSTGSGIAPCLALVGNAPNTQMRFIWSTRSPQETFGPKIINTVLRQDPKAIIWDTRKKGQKRPDLVQMAYEVYHEMEAEAVFFISNRGLTKKVIEGLERRGVAAFAPVFDS
jgi:hypothetical protein